MGRKRSACIGMLALGLSVALMGCGDRKKLEQEKSTRLAGIEKLDEGDYEKAVELFNQSLHTRTGKVTNLEVDINFYKAYAQMETGKVKEAIETYTALVEYDEKNAQAYYLRGCANISIGETKQAAQDFAQAAENNGEDGQMYAGIYEQLVSVGMLDEATSYLEKGLKIKDDSAAAGLFRGRLYLASGAYEKAEKELKKALENKEDAANLYLGDTARALGDSEEADRYYQVYIQKFPDDSGVLYKLGSLKFEDAAYDEAISYFDQGLSGETVTNRRELWSGKIAAMEHMGDFAGAKREIEEYLESYPDDEEAQREYIFLKTR